MTITNIVRNGKGVAGHWSVHSDASFGENTRQLRHYSTVMLEWDCISKEVLWSGLGSGSVSDAQGLNQAFKVLGAPLRYRRDRKMGGPRIESLATGLSITRPV